MARPNYKLLAHQAAVRHGLDPKYFVRQIQAESNFDPRAGSSAGAQGIAQIMPATARGWGVDPWDPHAALNAAAKNMAHYVKNYGGWKNALIAYNAGPGRVGKPLYNETRDYIHKILGDSNPKALPGGVRPVVRPGVQAPQIGQPVLPMQPAQLNPREKARLAQMQLQTRRFDPVKANEDQMRKLALATDGAGVLRQINDEQKFQTEEFNNNALAFNRQAEQTMLATKNESIRQKAMQDWLAQTGKSIQNMPTAGSPVMGSPGGVRKPGGYKTPKGFIRNQFEGEKGFEFLRRLGTKGFGLANDPGNSQLDGGRHSAGSEHYSDRAIDFGTARNSRDQLNAWMAFAKRMGFDALDEGDHIHVSMPGSGI